MTKHLLIIDNDTTLTSLLSHDLTAEGFDIRCAYDGEHGLKMALNQSFDMIISEVLLPICHGFDLLQTLRQHSNTPVLFLTAREDDIDRLIGLQLGADDYLLKPCDPRELIARVHAILRRTSNTSSTQQRQHITYHDIVINCKNRLVTLRGQALELTNTEFNILEILIKSPDQAFSKEELTEYALGRKFTAYDRSIDVHISNLRNKLGDNHHKEPWIKTVRGFGYQLNE